MEGCESCRLVARRDAGEAPYWDSFFRADAFDVVHALNTSLPGWMVIVARRHVESIAELSESEATELGGLIRRVSAGLQATLGCSKTYVMQFAEMKGHNHVHFHVVPRMPDLPDEHKGGGIFHYLNVEESVRLEDDEMNEVAKALHAELIKTGGPGND